MEMIKLFVVLLCVAACHPLNERVLEPYSGRLPLFTLAPDLILTTHTDTLSLVVMNGEESFEFAVVVTIDGKKYDLIGTPDVVTPSEIYADAGESQIIYRCDNETVILSFIAPEVDYGCHPVNYMTCKTVDGRPLPFRVEVDQTNIKGLSYGMLPFKHNKDSVFYMGYDDERYVQLFGRNILPIWKKNNDDVIADIVSEKNLRNPAKGPVDLRIKKAKLDLSQDKDGNLIYVTCYYINRMTEIVGYADTLAMCGERELLEGLMNPILFYAESDLWNAPFCPPDIGAYPLVMHRISDDTNYEWITEKALDIIADIDSLAANNRYSQKHINVIEQWKDYLKR